LFSQSGFSTTPVLRAPFVPAPDGTDTISGTGAAVKGKAFAASGGGWQVVRRPRIGNLDNNLAAVATGSPSDAWAVGY
jgi:hypothetical protein